MCESLLRLLKINSDFGSLLGPKNRIFIFFCGICKFLEVKIAQHQADTNKTNLVKLKLTKTINDTKSLPVKTISTMVDVRLTLV